LCELSSRVARGEQEFDAGLREFLDGFYANPGTRSQAIEDRPPPLDELRDAYLAAVAEHLARSHGLGVPGWAETQGLGLERPFFAGGLESTKAILLAQSPTAFRRRMLFVSRDALSRPHAAAARDEVSQANDRDAPGRT
jgi:hypothetical protein